METSVSKCILFKIKFKSELEMEPEFIFSLFLLLFFGRTAVVGLQREKEDCLLVHL